MKCEICSRDNLNDKEMLVHMKYFHKANEQQPQRMTAGACPDCGTSLFHQEGCATCISCGYSKCG